MEQKILNKIQLAEACKAWKLEGKSIVFTNGCFDIIHVGHLDTLQAAKALGDILIVGLNSDASVTRLKGAERPINSELNRALMLAALELVSAVVIFEEDTPLQLIELIAPNFLVKGGDWPENQIVGADFVKAYGGSVHSIPFKNDISTTAILKKIQGL
jgi:rfaE bifunctional protein nucleotidyltransferase chain/domain